MPGIRASHPQEGARTEEQRTEEEWTSSTVDAPQPFGPRTVVEQETEFKGVLVSTCGIEVKGHVKGDMTAPSLTVAASGAVQGNVKVGELSSEGEIAGDIDADVARLSGVVKDKAVLRAKSLEMKLSSVGRRIQVVFGESPPVVTRGAPIKT